MSDSPAPPPQARVPPAESPGLRALFALVVGVSVVTALYLGREVLIPITLAVLLSFVMAPLVDALRRISLGRVPSVLLTAALALAAMMVLAVLIGLQLASLADELPRYLATIQQKAQALKEFAVGRFSHVMEDVGRAIGDGTAATPASPATPGAGAAGVEAPRPVPVEMRPPAPSALETAERYLTPVIHPLAMATIVYVVAVFILLQREDLRDRLIRLAGANDLHRTTTALDDAARRLSRYFLTQLVINTAYGALTTVVLFLIGVPGALLWGILAGLMRYVPFVGTVIAALPPIVLAAAVDPGWSMVAWTAAFYVIGEFLMGQVVEPLAFGHSTGLSPTSVIVAAIFWSWIWGPIGLILSMPLTLCLVVLGRHVERLEFLDVMLGDRPALTPPESFYQRMLAGDPDEALDQAELLLKERSLSSYYDEVALKGLQLAAADVARGVLPPERLAGVRDAARSVIADLGSHDDTDPPAKKSEDEDATETPTLAEKALPREPAPETAAPETLPDAWRAERAILCIAGRGPLDEAAAAMLAQLLGKHGLGATLLPHAAVARDQLARLDVEGVRMVCISYLEIAGSPAHLRYLIRRLRQRLPKTPILVGLWPAEEAVLSDTALQAAIGANVYTATLRDAVAACVAAARKEDAMPPALAPAAE
ncbi:MAG TPA: AI-2E family transporter [Acetobacteraceae bacterium]|nr:AI-2E family transporter [Acetobacteraceae bacterium]